MKLVSLFAGAGGLDLGFTQAGAQVVWANEFDHQIWETYERNHPGTVLDRRSLTDIPSSEIPDSDGIIGGAPCQSWSTQGLGKGEADPLGKLFWEYARVIRDKQPKFFLAENVRGIITSRHRAVFDELLGILGDAGYLVDAYLLNTHDYNVPQTRLRVIIVGYRTDLGLRWSPPPAVPDRPTQWDALHGMPKPAGYRKSKLVVPGEATDLYNHHYTTTEISGAFIAANRCRAWHDPAQTVSSDFGSGLLHPSGYNSARHRAYGISNDNRQPLLTPGEAAENPEGIYRRMSVRELARLQTFPDDFIFHYRSVGTGHKMVGNAVPVEFARRLAMPIMKALGY